MSGFYPISTEQVKEEEISLLQNSILASNSGENINTIFRRVLEGEYSLWRLEGDSPEQRAIFLISLIQDGDLISVAINHVGGNGIKEYPDLIMTALQEYGKQFGATRFWTQTHIQGAKVLMERAGFEPVGVVLTKEFEDGIE